MARSAQQTLAAQLWPVQENTAFVRMFVLAFAGSVLLAISSKIKVPFYPVPMTMQTFVLLALSMSFGLRAGFATIMLYLAEGAFGLPVFAGTPEKGIGVAYMTGPTGGYLVGYVLAAVSVGYLAERGWDRNALTTAAAMLIGNALIYVPGLIWLGVLFGWDKPILEWGLTPFVFGDLAKLALAAAVMPLAWKMIKGGKG